MSPDQFIKEVSKAGQITTMVAEVARAKALAQLLAKVEIVDKSGNKVDIAALAPKTDTSSKGE
jgi:trigger factor